MQLSIIFNKKFFLSKVRDISNILQLFKTSMKMIMQLEQENR